MDITLLSITSLPSGGARVKYKPYALFDIRPDGIHRWKGINTSLSFVGENTAVKVLRQHCTTYPQSYWKSYGKTLEGLAFKNQVVEVGGTSYFIYIYDEVPYLMASINGDKNKCNTIASLTNNGLQLCVGVSVKHNLASDNNVVRVWRVS